MRTRSLQLLGTAILALGLLANGVGRGDDVLEEAKAKRAVEAQRLEKLVRDSRNDAYRLSRTRASDALELLKSTLRTLESDTILKEARRASLIRSVKLEIRDLEMDVRDRRAGVPADIDRATRADQDRRRAAETATIRRQQEDIRAMQSAGRTDEARRLYDDLVKRFPSNTAVKAGSTISGRETAVNSEKNLRRQREEGTLMVYMGIEKSRSLPLGDIEFPADWYEKSVKRSKKNNITDKERAILKALNTVLSVEFSMNTFQEVLDYLEKKTGQSLIVDKLALGEAGVTYDSQVNFKAKTTVRTILRRILGDLNLSYIIKDEAIQITSIQKAKETLSARTYYIGDLLGVGNFGFNPFMARAQMAAQVAQIATLITQTVEPESWMANNQGGLGTIAFDPVTMSFVVRQTAEIHYLMGFGMR